MTVVKPEGIVSFSGSIFWGVCAGSAESVVAGGAAAGATGPDFGGPGGVLVVGALARARIVLSRSLAARRLCFAFFRFSSTKRLMNSCVTVNASRFLARSEEKRKKAKHS